MLKYFTEEELTYIDSDEVEIEALVKGEWRHAKIVSLDAANLHRPTAAVCRRVLSSAILLLPSA